MGLFMSTVEWKFPLLRDLYLIPTLRVGRYAMLRFGGTRPNRGVMFSSRTRFQIRPVVARMEIWLAEFFRIPIMDLMLCM